MRMSDRQEITFEKCDEIKVLRDPIHGYVHVSYKVIWDLINCKYVQRLRRIKQLGTSYVVYHTAEHTRFSHCLGVYEIVRRMVDENEDIHNNTTERERIAVMCAGLLHDLGHGPFSHSFESLTDQSHETFSVRFILETEIADILNHNGEGLSEEVASILTHEHPKVLLSSMISGQLDADRMDYLLRDAYFTGTKYGDFDLERILRTLRVKDNRLVIKESGMHTVEDYIMARYHMYWQVYLHPVARSFECILISLFKRLKYLYETEPDHLFNYPEWLPLLSGNYTLENHYQMDEPLCYSTFARMKKDEDKILNDLARRLLDRDLFEYEDLDDTDIDDLKEKLKENGFDPDYYLIIDEVKQRPYMPYRVKDDRGIIVLMSDGSLCELSKASLIVAALIRAKDKNDSKVFYPSK